MKNLTFYLLLPLLIWSLIIGGDSQTISVAQPVELTDEQKVFYENGEEDVEGEENYLPGDELIDADYLPSLFNAMTGTINSDYDCSQYDNSLLYNDEAYDPLYCENPLYYNYPASTGYYPTPYVYSTATPYYGNTYDSYYYPYYYPRFYSGYSYVYPTYYYPDDWWWYNPYAYYRPYGYRYSSYRPYAYWPYRIFKHLLHHRYYDRYASRSLYRYPLYDTYRRYRHGKDGFYYRGLTPYASRYSSFTSRRSGGDNIIRALREHRAATINRSQIFSRRSTISPRIYTIGRTPDNIRVLSPGTRYRADLRASRQRINEALDQSRTLRGQTRVLTPQSKSRIRTYITPRIGSQDRTTITADRTRIFNRPGSYTRDRIIQRFSRDGSTPRSIAPNRIIIPSRRTSPSVRSFGSFSTRSPTLRSAAPNRSITPNVSRRTIAPSFSSPPSRTFGPSRNISVSPPPAIRFSQPSRSGRARIFSSPSFRSSPRSGPVMRSRTFGGGGRSSGGGRSFSGGRSRSVGGRRR
jgi:uncharacterized membrane protein YgcG